MFQHRLRPQLQISSAAPTGRKASYGGMDLNRIKSGKIVELWVNYDALGLLQQVGLVPPVKGIEQDAAVFANP